MSVTEQLAQFVVDTRWETIPEAAKLIEEQSQEVDPRKRQALVWQIQKKLEADAARPLFTHSVTYNCCRQEDTWLDR